jgi:hypothetical protein
LYYKKQLSFPLAGQQLDSRMALLERGQLMFENDQLPAGPIHCFFLFGELLISLLAETVGFVQLSKLIEIALLEADIELLSLLLMSLNRLLLLLVDFLHFI